MAGLSQKLRHRLTLQEKVQSQDPDTGAFVTTWQTVDDNVPASIEPLSAREYIAAQQVDSKVSARIVIRARSPLSHDMRFVDSATSRVFNIEGVLTDKDSGAEYFTLPVSEGVNDGR